ncbi:MurR/RpiR family transcriptional regulator [Clostridium sp. YIM B02551]|uniref:MurR/RpiR family transcriptional regulator n=1 Tax=Clostridium sp. YIM B02551 TaxID=2910679 RepID=UPI001EE9B76E|nr:MurR/RpiR family transcriptional regulator [Clostridium sp. YIM B02551]
MGFYVRIKQYATEFTQAEQKISDYILQNPEEVINFSAQQLAERTETSAASVVRFSRKLGFGGFGELKIEIAKTITNNYDDNFDAIISSEDSIIDITDKLVNKAVTSIKETQGLINFKDLEEAIEIIRKAENVYLFGVGASSLVAMDFMYKLARINKRVVYFMDSHLQLASSVHITEKDVAIGISYGGKTKEVNESISIAIEKGAKVIAITSCNKNPLSSMSDISLKVPNAEKQIRFGAISSRVAQLIITDTLFLGVAIDNLDKVENSLLETRKAVEKLK